MKLRIDSETEAQYRLLVTKAKLAEEAISELLLATVQSSIPDDAKLKVLDWISRADTFKGISYFLTPQTEWTGGDSVDANNHVVNNPHIAR